MKTSELLRGIAARIEEKGHYREGKTNGGGTCVMIAAVFLCPQENSENLATKIREAAHLPPVNDSYYTGNYGSVVAWNDSQPNGETVISALRSAADKAELEEGGQG